MRSRTAALCSILAPALWASDPALTIYNQGFAVVRERIPLHLKQGINHVEFDGVTALVEPSSVILRDASGRTAPRVLEQGYRADPASLPALLEQYEGQTISFESSGPGRKQIVSGKLIRAGAADALVEVDGKLRFGLPGTPLFPPGGARDQRPTLVWTIETAHAGKLDAELAYVSGGFNWTADYNLVQRDSGAIDLAGWMTMENRSGREFQNARVKVMAGDVNKLQPVAVARDMIVFASLGVYRCCGPQAPPVIEKTFDEYHLYTIQRAITFHDGESRQVEFARAERVKADTRYIYDGARVRRSPDGRPEPPPTDIGYRTESNSKVLVMREFRNSETNHLGIPLPKGRVRFYRRDADGRLEFTGEDAIGHTPKDETVRLFTGFAFDLTGRRKQTNFRTLAGSTDESFEIEVSNHKNDPVEIRVVEHLSRWSSWTISASSAPYVKTEAQTIEFHVPLPAGDRRTVTYTVHYTM